MNFLLLRGLIRERRHWGRFPVSLEARVPGARTYFLDFAGCGSECERVSPATVHEIREDVRKRFEARIESGEFPRGPWTLVAVSLGAMVGLDWIADRGAHPFDRAILMNTSARDAGPFHHRFSLSLLPSIAKCLVDFRPETYERVILEATSNLPREKWEAELATQIAWRKEQPITRHTFFAQLYAGAQFRLPPALSIPALILISARDRLVSPKLSERIAERYGLPKLSHDWAGHDLTKDDPEWAADRVREFTAAPV